jgi:GMP synthase (glutamine-hydrolysing)
LEFTNYRKRMFYILDFGSSKVPQLISMLNAIGYSSVAHPWDQPNRNARDHAKGIILSGSPTFLTEVDHAPYLRHCAFLKKTKIPVLGICFGHQVIGLVHGAEIYRGPEMRTTNKIKLLQEGLLFPKGLFTWPPLQAMQMKE